ncbi:PsiF family protein, partial [Enterobacter hormaechei]|uniref:PsiF family protein n=1 Tax=Enterobacter hormaechei TaxID=158836 RepID=UPI001CC285E4
LKGDPRKTYMSDCLKNGAAKPGEKSLTPQQQKMRECNAKATEQSLKGDDRSKFMSACLKKKV